MLTGPAVAPTTMPDPLGGQTATELTETAITSGFQIQQILGLTTLASSTYYVYSIYAKKNTAATRQYIQLYARDLNGGTNQVVFTLYGAGGVQTGTPFYPQIQALPNGWYRCSMVFNSSSGSTHPAAAVRINDDTGSAPTGAYMGTAGSGFYIWGAQLEALPAPPYAANLLPTSYIATTVAGAASRPTGKINPSIIPTLGAAASVTGTSGTTLTAAQLTGGGSGNAFILRSGPTVAFTDTSDTAANLVGAIPGAVIGTFFQFVISNGTAVSETLAGGTGVTLQGHTGVAASTSRTLYGIVTAVPGAGTSAAVTISG